MRRLLILLFVLPLFFGCINSSKVSEYTSYEYREVWYWVVQYDEGATKEDIESFVRKWANPNKTSYFFAYKKDLDISVLKSQDMIFPVFIGTILKTPPPYGYYKIPDDENLYDDAIWLLEQSWKTE